MKEKLKTFTRKQKRELIRYILLYVIVAALFVSYSAYVLVKDRNMAQADWDNNFKASDTVDVDLSKYEDAETKVMTGTYLETIRAISFKESSFRANLTVWFKWEGKEDLDMLSNFRIYNGYINKLETTEDYHEDGINYQSANVDVTITKTFDTIRFPLGSHILNIYVESEYPVDEVLLIDDEENSGINNSLMIAGFNIKEDKTQALVYTYDTTHGSPSYIEGTAKQSEHLTSLYIVRSSLGLYFKCFIALFGTIIWVLMVLYMSAFHKVDSLTFIPAALFGSVSNIMIGANLLPDGLEFGLLEMVNIFGVFSILISGAIIIHINNLRRKEANQHYRTVFVKTMFFIIVSFVVITNLLLPILAYSF